MVVEVAGGLIEVFLRCLQVLMGKGVFGDPNLCVGEPVRQRLVSFGAATKLECVQAMICDLLCNGLLDVRDKSTVVVIPVYRHKVEWALLAM